MAELAGIRRERYARYKALFWRIAAGAHDFVVVPDAIGHRQAVLLIESFRRFPVQDVTSGIMMAALDACQRFQLSYWDAVIIEASRAMGCAQVLSEDLDDGRDYGGVQVANPFR
jgi:predicted nucleic acid-binding protein